MDDLTPEELWPASWRGRPDPKRELAFRSGLFTAAEVRSRADAYVLLAVREDGWPSQPVAMRLSRPRAIP